MRTAALGNLGILVVEDEPLLRKHLAAYLQKQGAEAASADSLQAARALLEKTVFDFALLDVNLPDGLGTDLLKGKFFSANTGVIVMTAEGGITGAVEAMRLGALEYLVKPFDLAELPMVIGRAQQAKQAARLEEHRRSDATLSGDTFFFGSSLSGLNTQLAKILAADVRMQSRLPPVLIEGETGTGKTTIARWLHHHGPRAAQPLVEINCSALPETLAESELFGHERGAFTDAKTARIGLFEAANGGTLFLDELPSLSLGLQAKVLKTIEDHRIRRVGGNKEIPVDVRLISATNRDLKTLVAHGQFREDLFHRLDLYRLQIVPLRDRTGDILPLTETLITRIGARHRLPSKQITELGKKRLLSYRWPGNVRELSHELERAMVFEESNELNFDHLVPSNSAGNPISRSDSEWYNEGFVFPENGFSLDEAINRLIGHALKQTGDNVSAAARLLGVSRDYLRYRLENQKPSLESGE
jgi:DNA-binding NtrC family response regulator